ncbi:hypothetical protein R50073_33620 [Maricurvus nonylphenolicus]|uniref:hypothetical protein n=1 Tax=Maricurvus nonylphenolicus TaxID=1008307 RepID=UPI0036F1DB3A
MDTALRNPNLTFSAPELAGPKVGGSAGLKYHAFSTRVLKDEAEAKQYVASTGLNEDTGVSQSWGTDTKHAVMRSRRGSIGGLVKRSDGSHAVWRMSSHATSEALQESTQDHAEAKYHLKATELATAATNTRGTKQSVNAVLSDFGKVQYIPPSSDYALGFNAFQLTEATNATSVSGTGLARSVSKDARADLFAPSIASMQDRGKKPNPSQAFHSEPMAISFHNTERAKLGKPSLRESSEMVGIMESFPNQICAQCGPMMSEYVGPDSMVGGNPGVPFGGQKPGGLFPHEVVDSSGKQLGQSTVFRAHPSQELTTETANAKEVRAIHAYHKA